MSVTNLAFAFTALALAGRFTTKKSLTDLKFMAGVGGTLVGLAALNTSNPKLAQQFGILLVFGALFVYGNDIFKALGDVTTGPPQKGGKAFKQLK